MNHDLCMHKNLVLLSGSEERVRCVHCHLTLKRDELRRGYCPECYEATGEKRYDFEAAVESTVQYRCEDCGVLISVA